MYGAYSLKDIVMTSAMQTSQFPPLMSGRGLLNNYMLFCHHFAVVKVWLIYNVVPISAVQPSDPIMYVGVYVSMQAYTFPFLYYLPSWSVPRDWIAFPALYNRISLLIHSKRNS